MTSVTSRDARLRAATIETKNITTRYVRGKLSILSGTHTLLSTSINITSVMTFMINNDTVDTHISRVISCKRSASITLPRPSSRLFRRRRHHCAVCLFAGAMDKFAYIVLALSSSKPVASIFPAEIFEKTVSLGICPYTIFVFALSDHSSLKTNTNAQIAPSKTSIVAILSNDDNKVVSPSFLRPTTQKSSSQLKYRQRFFANMNSPFGSLMPSIEMRMFIMRGHRNVQNMQ
jgi:hypothetical protein